MTLNEDIRHKICFCFRVSCKSNLDTVGWTRPLLSDSAASRSSTSLFFNAAIFELPFEFQITLLIRFRHFQPGSVFFSIYLKRINFFQKKHPRIFFGFNETFFPFPVWVSVFRKEDPISVLIKSKAWLEEEEEETEELKLESVLAVPEMGFAANVFCFCFKLLLTNTKSKEIYLRNAGIALSCFSNCTIWQLGDQMIWQHG